MAINIGTLLVELGVNMGGFIEGMDKATYKAKQAGKEIGESFKGLGRDIGGILGQFGDVGSVIGESLGSAGEIIAKVAGQFGSLGGAAGAAALGIAAVGAVAIAAVAGVSAMAVAGAELVHELELASAKTGIAVHDLQVLQAAGGTVGVSLDQMVTGFRKFDQALVGIGSRSGAANLVLQQLSINSRDNKEALYEVADAFSKMEDGPTKAAYAVQLFGRAGLNLIPLLDKGRDGLREFENIVDEFGPKIGVQAKEANEAFLLSQTKVSLAWDNLKVKAEEAFLPAISKVITIVAQGTKAITDFDESINKLRNSYVLSSDAFSAAGVQTQNKVRADLGIETEGPKKKEGDSALLLSALKERFEWIKAGGQAEYEFKKTEQDITELLQVGTAQALRRASALQDELPKLKVAADIERQRNEYRANPKPAAPGADKELEFEKNLQERVQKQRDLASAVNSTAAANIIQAATDDANLAISKQLIGYQGELVKINQELARVPSGTQQSADLLAKKNQLQGFIDTLHADTPEIVRNYQEIAAATQINKAGAGLESAVDKLGEQNNALRELAAAYDQGGEAIRNAQIDQSLAKEQIELNRATQAYTALVAKVGEYAASLTPEKTALDEAAHNMKLATDIARENADLKLDIKLKDEAKALEADAEAWQIQADAIHASNAEKIEAARHAAEVIAAAKPGATSAEVSAAGTAAAQKEEQSIANKIKEKTAQLDLNGSLREEIELYNDIIAKQGANSEIGIQAQAAMKKAIESTQRAWDQAAIDVGDFRHKAAGFLNELVLDGQNFWGNFAQAGLTAIKSTEDELAKMLVTGKGNFKQIEQGLEESLLKNSIQTVVSKGAGSIANALGLGGLIPQGKPDGTRDNPLYVMDASSSGTGGLLGGGLFGNGDFGGETGGGESGGGGGIGGFFSGLVSFFGGLFGGGKAGGGDVTPGKMYLVGEKHPEFFIPGKSGTIVPTMNVGGGKQVNMSVHFHGVTDADSFKKSQSQIMGNIHRSAAIALQRGA